MRIVDDAHERVLLGGLREQAEHGDADQKTVLDGRRREAERTGERGRLRVGEPLEAVEDGMEELVQRGERELGLRFDAAGAQHPHPRGLRDRVPEQSRLADAGLAPDHQRAAARGPGVCDQALDSGRLGLSAEKHPTDRNPARTHWLDRRREGRGRLHSLAA